MTGPARCALVTGAASGIGRATAELLLSVGWRVVGLDLREDMPLGIDAIIGDAADARTLERALERVGPRLDGLVCSAGVPPTGPWDDPAHWEVVLRVDLTAVFHALRLAMPSLRAARGSVVVVGSIVGTAEGSARSPAYAAAKAGLVGLVRSVALVGAPHGVRVNAVEPGSINTPFDPPRFPAPARPDVPLGRMGAPDEVARVIRFLLEDASAYITGAGLRVDGGRTIQGGPDRVG